MTNTTGARIRRERIRRNWRQEDLSAMTGLSINTIGNVENDRFPMREPTLRAIASALNMPVEYLRGSNDGNGPDLLLRRRAGRGRD